MKLDVIKATSVVFDAIDRDSRSRRLIRKRLAKYRAVRVKLAFQSMLVATFSAAAWAQPVEPVFAPNPVRIGGLACATCKITVERYSRIGTANEPGTILDRPSIVLLDSRRRVIVSGANGLPQVWSLDGKYQRSIGRSGAGPGEFKDMPESMRVGPGDSLWVFQQLAVSIFAPDGHYVRSFRTVVMPAAPVLLGDGRLVLGGSSNTRELAGLQLHVMDSDGVLRRSFALVPPHVSARGHLPLLLPFPRAVAGDEFWTRDGGTYGFYKWSSNGSLVSAFQRDAAWFNTRFDRGADPKRPVSWMAGAREDSLGRVWTISRVPSQNWQEYTPSAPVNGEAAASPFRWDKLFDTMIEVIDVKSAKVLASARIPGFPLDLLDGGHLATFEVDAADIPQIQIWRIAIPGGGMPFRPGFK